MPEKGGKTVSVVEGALHVLSQSHFETTVSSNAVTLQSKTLAKSLVGFEVCALCERYSVEVWKPAFS